jgi:hypothetical protein
MDLSQLMAMSKRHMHMDRQMTGIAMSWCPDRITTGWGKAEWVARSWAGLADIDPRFREELHALLAKAGRP